MLRFAEEILLLLLDENRGDLTPVPGWSLSCALAGAVLMDLALENRIDTDVEHLILTDSTPLGDDLLDPALEEIAQSDQTHPTRFWVEHFAAQADDIREKTLARLVERGIVEVEEEGGFLSLSSQAARVRRYPLNDSRAKDDVRLRVMRVLFISDIPDPRDIVIICLADACGLFERLISVDELGQIQERVEAVSRLDLIGQSVAEAIRQSEEPAEIVRPTKAIPKGDRVSFTRVLLRDYREFFIDQYRRFGPIFQVRDPINRPITIMTGPEALLFYAKNAKTHFRSHEAWIKMNKGYGALRFLVSMDGEEHFRMRRIQTPGLSRAVAEKRVPLLIDLVRREIASWPMGKPIPGTETCQRIIYDLSSNLMASMSIPDYFDDVRHLADASFNHTIEYAITSLNTHFKLLMRTPRLRRARARTDELAAKIIAAHDPKKRGNRDPDLIDDLLDLHHTDPQFLPETDLKMAVLSPLWLGLHTAGHAAPFMLYELLKHPDVLQQAKDEADALFAQGLPTAQGLRSLDVIPRILMETLRLHTPTPGLKRTVTNSFEFAGCTVPAGESVVISLALCYSLPEYFANPEQFDIDRFAPPRNEHKQPGVYHPYGIGTHRCLGGYLAEFMIVTVMATILHEVELALHPPNYKLKEKNQPTSHPNDSFKFKVTHRR